MSYSSDRSWSDQFIADIQNKIGPHLLSPAPFHADAQQATDLMILQARDIRVAARVRRHGYAHAYPHDFTIRAHRDNGARTELQKLLDGYGDWFFYGHAHEHLPIVEAWMLIDLNIWRGHLLRKGHGQGWGGLADRRSNGDGTHFFAFDVRRFPAEMLIAGSLPIADQVAA